VLCTSAGSASADDRFAICTWTRPRLPTSGSNVNEVAEHLSTMFRKVAVVSEGGLELLSGTKHLDAS